MQASKVSADLERILADLGYTVRKEKGSFNSDFCLVEGQKLIVVNKSKPIDTQVAIYCRLLKDLELDDIYIKPSTWKYLKNFWEKMEKFEQN